MCQHAWVDVSGVISKLSAFVDENSPEPSMDGSKNSVAFTKSMAAIRRSFKKPDEPGSLFKALQLHSPDSSMRSVSSQMRKLMAFVQGKLFSNFPVQYIAIADLAHRLYAGMVLRRSDRKELLCTAV